MILVKTEREYIRGMLANCDVSQEAEREAILKAEARIETIEGYKRAFRNRLRELEANKEA